MKRLYVLVLLLSLPFFAISQSLDELNKPIIGELDEVTTFSEGVAAVRKGDQWGFIDTEGKLVIDFRGDLVSNKDGDTSQLGVEGISRPHFKEGLCLIKVMNEEGIPRYGFMDSKGKTVIEPEFLNLSQFENGLAVGIYEKSTPRGKNQFQLNIYDYTFTEVVINKEGDMLWPIQERQNIVMSKKMYKLPELHAKMLAKDLLAIKGKDNNWKVVKPQLNNK